MTGKQTTIRGKRPLGAHMPIRGGLVRAVERALSVGADALQIFSKNQLQWAVPELAAADAAAFRAAVARGALRYVCVHASYLINLASPNGVTREKSRQHLVAELRRAECLGCACVVLHPGSPRHESAEQGESRLVEGLAQALAETSDCSVGLALENTAGQGAVLGARLEDLGRVIQDCAGNPRLGLCLDTCHAFAAGYDLRQASVVEGLVAEVERTVGLERLWLLHLNDSQYDCGSARDRHAHIGRGQIGASGFRHILRQPKLQGIPGILETPKHSETLAEDRLNLGRLRRLE